MNQAWKTEKLGDVCGFVRGPFGGSLKKRIFVENGFAVYEQSHAIYNQFDKIRYFINDDKFKEMARFELKPGNLIMSCSGTMGKVAIVPNDVKQGIINQALLLLKPNKSLLNTFLKYWIESDGFQESLKAYSLGAAIQNVASVKTLKKIQVPLPLIPKQKRIVKILDGAFAAIDKAKANAEKNLQNSRELFDSFLNKVFANPGEDWEERELGEVCEVKDGTHDSPKYVNEGIPFVTQKNIREYGLSLENTKFIAEADHEKFYKRSNVSKGDILISMIGANRGMTCMVDVKDLFSIKNVGLVKLNQNIDQHYLLFFLKSPVALYYVKSASKGGAQEFIGLKALRAFPILVPPIAKQKLMVKTFEALLNETKRLKAIYQQKHADLKELKKSILQKAFEGQL